MAQMQQHMNTQLEKLRGDAKECALISTVANDDQERALFSRLAEDLAMLADLVEIAIEIKKRQVAKRAAAA